MTRRPPRPALLGAFAVVAVVGLVGSLVATGVIRPGSSSGSDPGGGSGSASASAAVSAAPATPRPIPGHEVFGFVPYWEMDAGLPAHVKTTDLTTLALFSVTNRSNGTLDTSQRGYVRIAGPIGSQLIREAHGRSVRVELVYTSFGTARNQRLFGGPAATQDKVIAGLVELVGQLGFDGVNVDVEQLDGSLIEAYGGFVGRLRAALVAKSPRAQVSVATTGGETGAAMAVAATAAGADRIFLMGYDYHWSGSDPGASAPLGRWDGQVKDLGWSLDLYEALGVPVERTILGLPLYGMAWPVVGPELGAANTGPGKVWIPEQHLDVLKDPTLEPTLDSIEQVELYAIPTGGGGTSPAPASPSPPSPSPPSPPAQGATASPSVAPGDWLAIYIDSPATLTPKLALADDRGLAGAGFWAIGYERGLPEFTALIGRFRAGKLGGG